MVQNNFVAIVFIFQLIFLSYKFNIIQNLTRFPKKQNIYYHFYTILKFYSNFIKYNYNLYFKNFFFINLNNSRKAIRKISLAMN